jgi:YD repeat-containing protein
LIPKDTSLHSFNFTDSQRKILERSGYLPLEAYLSGSEARDFINNTNSGTATGPYRQSFTYDAWNNTLTGGGRFWSRTDVVTASYNQSNRNANWSYDAEGNVTSRNEAFGGGMSPGYSYDAAGLKVSLTQMRSCWLAFRLHRSSLLSPCGDGVDTRMAC